MIFCLFQRVEDLSIEKLITKLSIEALAVAIFPGTAWFLSAVRAYEIGMGV